MRQVIVFFSNLFVIVPILSWLEAQVLKTIIYAVMNKHFDITRLFGDGGMPSGHSATIVSLAASVGLSEGFDSAVFAVACIVAIIVCHDATGVRLETGKQSAVIMDLQKTINMLTSDDKPIVKLREFVGHTHMQVFAGAILGITNAFTGYYMMG